jgi:hypothetical protein
VVLTPNSQYVAHLVATPRPAVPLKVWSFTTSSFATFTDLVTRDRELLRPHVCDADSTALEFDEYAREIDIDTIAYVQRFRVTPLLTFDQSACASLLFESPEPLEAGSRLTVRVAGGDTQLTANVDGTRVIVRAAGGGTFAKAELDVELRYRRNAGPALPVLAIDGDSADEIESFTINAGAEP